MKNHIKIDGKLLQTNKKWSHLKNSQRSWIQEITKQEHEAYVAENGRLPMKKCKEVVIDKIYEHVDKRGIWIPFYEFKSHVSIYLDRLNRKSPLFTPPKKEASAKKPKPPRANFEEFPPEVQDEIKMHITGSVNRYILQSHNIPPNKIRDNEIKNILRGFNSKK